VAGLPVGIQIVGRHRDEWSVLQIAHAFEQVTQHGKHGPRWATRDHEEPGARRARRGSDMIASGARLGPYEITAAIGAGGMGEVFRAHDAKLNRDVAIKVLPAALASDRERLGRFKREAQVLASLNHPNIAHVYGFETATLPDGSTVHFLAMELGRRRPCRATEARRHSG
jgi:serine/threonine protein kinase